MKVKRNPVAAVYCLVGGIMFFVIEMLYIWLLLYQPPPAT